MMRTITSLKIVSSAPTPTFIGQDVVTAGIAHFEEKFKFKIKVKHRTHFLKMKYESLGALEKGLGAYRVFGDLGYGKK